MMEEDKPRVYAIPENFIDESRIVRGMFKTRNFIEGLIMGGISAIPALFIPAESFNTRVTLITAFAAPLFLLGNNGFNGDPISTTLKNARNWFRIRSLMLYNSGTRALKEAPLTVMMERPQASDKILDILDIIKENRREKAAKVKYIEGETFEFAEDSELSGNYVEEAVRLNMDPERFVPNGVEHAETPPGTAEHDLINASEPFFAQGEDTEIDITFQPKPRMKQSVPVEPDIHSEQGNGLKKGGLYS